MANKTSFSFLGIKVEAEGIKSVKIMAVISLMALIALIVISMIWSQNF